LVFCHPIHTLVLAGTEKKHSTKSETGENRDKELNKKKIIEIFTK
jgi:hypothetical protein